MVKNIPGIIILELFFQDVAENNSTFVYLHNFIISECLQQNINFNTIDLKNDLQEIVLKKYRYDCHCKETSELEIKISEILTKPLNQGIYIKLQNYNKNLVKTSNILDFFYTKDIKISDIKLIGKHIVYKE